MVYIMYNYLVVNRIYILLGSDLYMLNHRECIDAFRGLRVDPMGIHLHGRFP